MLFVIVLLVSNLLFLLDTPDILEIKTINILKIFSTGMLTGVLIIFTKDWVRNRKEAT